VNAELVLLAAAAALPPKFAIILAMAATLGQMVGKCVMFYGGRGVKFLQRGIVKEKVDAMCLSLQRRNGTVNSFVLTSAATGLPPFYLVSVASGLAGIPITRFFVLGTTGRFLRFYAVVLFPQFIKAIIA
jgi:membrane protein YqaA with SNARE-associated domain